MWQVLHLLAPWFWVIVIFHQSRNAEMYGELRMDHLPPIVFWGGLVTGWTWFWFLIHHPESHSHVEKKSHRSLVVCFFRSPPRYSTAFPLKAPAFAGVTSWKRMSPVYMVNLESSFRDEEFCNLTRQNSIAKYGSKWSPPRITKRTLVLWRNHIFRMSTVSKIYTAAWCCMHSKFLKIAQGSGSQRHLCKTS